MRVLVAIDGSDDAKAAIAWLGRLPLPAGHNIRLLTVVVPPIALIDVDKALESRAALIAEAQQPSCPRRPRASARGYPRSRRPWSPVRQRT